MRAVHGFVLVSLGDRKHFEDFIWCAYLNSLHQIHYGLIFLHAVHLLEDGAF